MGGMCGVGGMHGRGHAWWGLAWQGACVAGRYAWQGGMQGRGIAWQGDCMAEGGMHGSEGACVAGNMHARGHAWWGWHAW